MNKTILIFLVLCMESCALISKPPTTSNPPDMQEKSNNIKELVTQYTFQDKPIRGYYLLSKFNRKGKFQTMTNKHGDLIYRTPDPKGQFNNIDYVIGTNNKILAIRMFMNLGNILQEYDNLKTALQKNYCDDCMTEHDLFSKDLSSQSRDIFIKFYNTPEDWITNYQSWKENKYVFNECDKLKYTIDKSSYCSGGSKNGRGAIHPTLDIISLSVHKKELGNQLLVLTYTTKEYASDVSKRNKKKVNSMNDL